MSSSVIEDSEAQQNEQANKHSAPIKNNKLLSKIASSVKLVLRVNLAPSDSSTNNNGKQLLRKDSRSNVMRVAYIGANGQLTNKALLVPKERLEKNVDIEVEEDRKLLINVLLKRPHRRYDNEIMFLQKALRDTPFFQKIEPDLDEISFKKIFGALQLEVTEGGQKLFEYGDISQKFYIIIQGSVYTLLNKDEANTQAVPNPAPQSRKSIINTTSPEELEKKRRELPKRLFKITDEELKRSAVEECFPDSWLAKKLRQGEAFGEIGLEKTGDRKRTSTAVCAEKTLLGILTFEDYQSILGALYERKYYDKINFFLKTDLFQHWRASNLAFLILHMEETRQVRNQVIFKEGERSNRIYFVLKGEVELKKQVEIPRPPKSDEEPLQEENTLGGKRVKIHKKPEPLRLAIISEGDYFGESEFINMKQREYTAVIASTEATLISINRANFMAFVKDTQTFDNLKDHIQNKARWRQELTSKYVKLHMRRDETPMKNEDSRNSLNTSLANYSSPKHTRPRISSTHNDSRHLNTSQGSAQAYENGYSKAVTKFRKTHRHTHSMTKVENVNTSVPKEVVIDILKNPKFLPSLSVKKSRRKFEHAYEDTKKRLAKKLQDEREQEEHEEEKERNATLKEEAEEVPKTTVKSPEVRNEQAPYFSQNLKRFLTPKAPFRIITSEASLNELPDNSFSRSTRQTGIKIFSLNAYETPKTKTQTQVQARNSFVETEQTQNLQARRSISTNIIQDRKRIVQSLNEVLPEAFVKKDDESAEKPSSTARFHNRLKKILEIKDNSESSTKPYYTKFKAFQPSTEYSMVNTQVLGSTKHLGLKKFKDL